MNDEQPKRTMRGFCLKRLLDKNGVSGIGVVAEGVLFANGWVVLRWTGEKNGINSLSWFPSYDQMCRAHGHGGKTEVVWMCTDESTTAPCFQSEHSIDSLANRVSKLLAQHAGHILHPEEKDRPDQEKIAGKIIGTIIAAEERAYQAGWQQANAQMASWPPKRYGVARNYGKIRTVVLNLFKKFR